MSAADVKTMAPPGILHTFCETNSDGATRENDVDVHRFRFRFDPAAVCALFEATVVSSMRVQIHGPRLNDQERVRLVDAFNQVLAFVLTFWLEYQEDDGDEVRTKRHLEKIELKELLRIQEVARWLWAYCDREQRAQLLGATTNKGQEEYDEDTWTEPFRMILTVWNERLASERAFGRFYIPDDAPLDFFAVFDRWQHYVDLYTTDVSP